MIKGVVNVAAALLVLPLVVACKTSIRLLGEDRGFVGYCQCAALIPGLSGQYLRRAFLRRVVRECGDDVCICFGTLFSHASIEFGDRVYVGPSCMIGSTTIRRDVLIGSNVSIINGNRQHGIESLDIPVREQPGEYMRITIGEDTWIGDRAIVMADVGKHAVVGAGSVVTKPVDDYAIVVGNPARKIGDRRELAN